MRFFDSSAVCPETRDIVPHHYNPLLYSGFETRRALRQGVGQWLNMGLEFQLSGLRCLRYLGNPFTSKAESYLGAMVTMNERLSRDYDKPEFKIGSVLTADGMTAITEQVMHDRPFGALLRFEKASSRKEPKVLVVAPMSGHYATLLRDTVETLLVDHDVYITDWHNARDIATSDGDFGFEDYVRYIVDFLGKIGPGTHLLAVCQPTVPSLVATAHMEETDNPCRPASLTLMGGPIDTEAAPTEVTRFADKYDIEWFEKAMIAKVPTGYRGAGRLVYPGFVQLASFLAMNPEKHARSHVELFENLAGARHELSQKSIDFYDEYLAVCDLPARFYLETIDRVFLRRDLARGRMMFQGKKVAAASITRTPLFTVEGANDDISAPGQTLAAHTICCNLPDELRFQYLQEGVGHYGVFSGRRWRSQIAPRITDFIRRFDSAENAPAWNAIDVPRLNKKAIEKVANLAPAVENTTFETATVGV